MSESRTRTRSQADKIYSHAAMLELSVCESDETGGDVSFVVGQLLYAALVVAAAAARAADAGATRETASVVAMSGLCHCAHNAAG